MTKEEIITQMKFHRAEYEKLRDEWGKFTREDELKRHHDEQTQLLTLFKEKLKYYAEGEDGIKEIDWAEVEKLITTSWNGQDGHALCWDEHGTCGIAVSYPGGGGFQAMFEDELDMKRHAERQSRIRMLRKSNASTKTKAAGQESS